MENSNYKLTCGVFFSILCHIQLPRKSASEHYLGEGDELTDSSMMYELISVITKPTTNYLFDTGIINKFKTCKSSSLGWFNWYDEKMINFFDRQMHSSFNSLKNKMVTFINKTLNLTYDCDKWLVASLLKIIDSDKNIDNKEFLYNRKMIKKDDFVTQEEYDLPAFLLSILHFIVFNRIENTLGKDTMDEIAPSAGGSKRQIGDDFPGDNYWKLRVNFEPNKKEPQVEEPEAVDTNDDIEIVDNTSYKNKNDGTSVQNIQNATINNVSGDQYNVSGNLIINKK